MAQVPDLNLLCVTGKALSDKEMTPEVAALFFAGVDTTGHTGTWLL